MGLEPRPVLVVVSHHDARPPSDLLALLEALHSTPAGWPFRARVVVNQERPENRPPSLERFPVDVLLRPNAGYNIGAWDHGWRTPPEHFAYLFLQEECHLRRTGWLSEFVRRSTERGIGLLGERLSPPWDAPWEVLAQRFRGHRLPGHEVEGREVDRLERYLRSFEEWGVPRGPRGDHLQSLVLFARREVLEAIDGFPIGRTYGEAIAAEIAISKKVQALGLRIDQVGREPFTCFDHPQWVR